jgi:hypothetical protein
MLCSAGGDGSEASKALDLAAVLLAAELKASESHRAHSTWLRGCGRGPTRYGSTYWKMSLQCVSCSNCR